MILPLELLPSGHSLGPVAPIKDEDGHCRLVVGERLEKVSFKEAIVTCGDCALVALGSSRACRGQVKGLDTDRGGRIVRSHCSLLLNDVSDASLNDLRDDRVGLFGADQVDERLHWLHGELVYLVEGGPDEVVRGGLRAN